MSIRVAQRIHDLDSGLEKGLQKPLLVCDSLPLKKKKNPREKKKKNSWKMYTGLNIAVEFSRCCSSISSKSFPEDRARDSDEDRADSWAPDQVSELRLLTLCSDSSPRRGVMHLTEGSQETAEPPDAQQASAGTFPFRSKTDSSRDFSSAHRSLTSTDDCPPSPSHVLRSYVALFSPWAFSAHPPPLP